MARPSSAPFAPPPRSHRSSCRLSPSPMMNRKSVSRSANVLRSFACASCWSGPGIFWAPLQSFCGDCFSSARSKRRVCGTGPPPQGIHSSGHWTYSCSDCRCQKLQGSCAYDGSPGSSSAYRMPTFWN